MHGNINQPMEFMKQFRSDKLTTAHALVASWFLGYFLIKQKVTKAIWIDPFCCSNLGCLGYQQSLEFSGDFNFVLNAFCILVFWFFKIHLSFVEINIAYLRHSFYFFSFSRNMLSLRDIHSESSFWSSSFPFLVFVC